MLFESEKKANNFIKFNSEEILQESDHSPERSYFCIACNGWHVTSWQNFSGKSKTEKVLEFYQKEKEIHKSKKQNLATIKANTREAIHQKEKALKVLLEQCDLKYMNEYALANAFRLLSELELEQKTLFTEGEKKALAERLETIRQKLEKSRQ